MDFDNIETQGEYQYKTEDLLSTEQEDRKKRREEKRRAKRYKFTDKTHPVTAFISCGFALASVVLFIWAVVISAMAGGNGGSEVGVLGLLVLVSSVMGFIFALIALSKTDIKKSVAWTGLFVNIIFMIILACLILIEVDFS